MLNDIKEAIEKNLPAQFSGILKERFADLEQKEKYLEEILEEKERLREELNEVRMENINLKDEINRHDHISLRLKKVEEGEQALSLERYKFDIKKEAYCASLEANRIIADRFIEYTKILVGHPSIKISNRKEVMADRGEFAEYGYTNGNNVPVGIKRADEKETLFEETITTESKGVD